MANVILFNKPYGVHSQFRKDNDDMATLADFFADKTLRVAGRLDKDSEGLLILTDDGALNHAITTPPNKGNAKEHGKTYLVQVENIATAEQLHQLSSGVPLKDGKTLPAVVRHLSEDELPIELWRRDPPIRERKSIPTSWLSMTIFEGKNRQVRRMVAHVGLPCLRLIRYQVGQWSLGDKVQKLGVGEQLRIQLSDDELNKLGVSKNNPIKPSKSKPSKTSEFSPKSTKPNHPKNRHHQANNKKRPKF